MNSSKIEIDFNLFLFYFQFCDRFNTMALNEQSRAAIRRLTSDFKEIQSSPIGGKQSSI